jgi:hypothetical protein
LSNRLQLPRRRKPRMEAVTWGCSLRQSADCAQNETLSLSLSLSLFSLDQTKQLTELTTALGNFGFLKFNNSVEMFSQKACSPGRKHLWPPYLHSLSYGNLWEFLSASFALLPHQDVSWWRLRRLWQQLALVFRSFEQNDALIAARDVRLPLYSGRYGC